MLIELQLIQNVQAEICVDKSRDKILIEIISQRV